MTEHTRLGRVISCGEGKTLVSLETPGACASCKAKGHCGEAGGREILLEGSFAPGEKLQLSLLPARGLGAALGAFGIPTTLLFLGYILGFHFTGQEGIGALLALGGVALGWLLLFLFNPIWKKLFPLKVESQRDPDQNQGGSNHGLESN